MALIYWDGKGWKPRSFARQALGADVYLCCPGPSLSQTLNPPDLHRPGIVSIAVNKAYPYMKRPDFWIGTDHPACFDGGLLWEPFPKVLRMCWREQKMFGVPIKACPNTVFVDVDPNVHPLEMFNRRLDNLIITAPQLNSFEAALHWAVWIGGKRIHLVGCDFGGKKDYYDDTVLTEEYRRGNRRLYAEQVKRLIHHVVEGKMRAIDFISCTPDSPINGFMPYVPLAKALHVTGHRVPQAWSPQPHARDASLCRWALPMAAAAQASGQKPAHPKQMGLHPRGVVVGVIEEQAWMLEWWYENFRKHNPELPVAFAGFGVSAKTAAGCRERGMFFEPAVPDSVGSWFRKPFAILQAPFEDILWLDLDTEVRGSVNRFFDYMGDDKIVVAGRNVLAQNYGTAQMHGWWLMLPKADADVSNGMVACTGIIGCKRGDPAVEEWALCSIPPTEFTYKGDHEILAIILWRRGYPRHQVTGEEFTLARFPVTQEPLIMHHAGVPAKKRLMERVEAKRTGRGHMCAEEHERLMGIVSGAGDNGSLRILEIGVAEGNTGTAMMRAGMAKGACVTYVGVDPGRWRGANFSADVRDACELHLFHESSSRAQPAVAAICAQFDIVLIDGCHCAACVKGDKALYAPMVAPGGYLIFHDTRRPLEDLSAQPGSLHRGHGVKPVYEAAKAEPGWVDEGEVGRWGLGVLRREIQEAAPCAD